ncbi:rod shape-determining protein [Candidatus Dojkabacteria bacterium]|nr:rod shape-determining protein [Candidatus Dojkabacteria bacterium]
MAGKKIGIDLGTANSIVWVEGKGIVIEEPTVVTVSVEEKKILAVGKEAREMLGKVPTGIVARRPLRQGVIASYKLTEALLKAFLDRAIGRSRLFKPEVMISVPSGVTSVEERAVIEAVSSAGAGRVYLIPESIAAAIGARMPISTSSGNMIVNMGGGTSEIAVISMNGIVRFDSKRVAGDAVNEAIMNTVRKKLNLVIGEQMAEKAKIQIGSAMNMEKPLEMEVKGRDASSGLPTSIVVNSNDIAEGIKLTLNQIIGSIKKVLEDTPPELASDIIDRGIVLTGGTAQLRGMDELFTRATGVPVYVADEPIYAVIKGIAEAIQNLEIIKRSLRVS